MKIKISNKLIGKNEPCFIIAEAGVNHNGNLGLAKKLVDVAKEAGVDAVKFQTFKSENLTTKNAEKAKYQGQGSQQNMLKNLELSYEDFIKLKEYCDNKNILFLSTPHCEDVVNFLDKIVPCFKVGSGDLTNIPFLKQIAKTNKPIILSTGMAYMAEVKEAFDTIYSEGNKQIIVLHCTTDYPCPLNNVNLRAMQTIQKELDCLVGYSDHTLGTDIALMAARLGAVVIEKHFTLSKEMIGPDHKASLTPKELKQMVKKLRNKDYPKFNDIVLGSKEKKPTKKELGIVKLIRKSVVSNKNIKKEEKITKDMLIIKRPGIGIPPKELKNLIGKIAKNSIKKDTLIRWSDLDESPKIFVASFNRASDGGISLLLKKMNKNNMLTDDYKKADFILAVGDRIETFYFVLKRFQENKRIIHLWAGEISQGTHDEVYRHAMTIMSEMQLCTNPKAKKRVIDLCKAVDKKPNAHIIGNLMLDNFKIDKSKVPKKPYDLVLYNPPTKLSKKEILKEIKQIKRLSSKNYIWIESNGDFGSELIKPYITHSNFPRPEFLGLMKYCRKFITNSSCMYHEAPFLLKQKQIISIGKRNINRESKHANMKIKNASTNIIKIFKKDLL